MPFRAKVQDKRNTPKEREKESGRKKDPSITNSHTMPVKDNAGIK